MNPPADYLKSYNEKSFWRKVRKYARATEKQLVSKALVPYYCFSDPATPKWVKGIIAGDLGALAAATALVAARLKKTPSDAAKTKLTERFG